MSCSPAQTPPNTYSSASYAALHPQPYIHTFLHLQPYIHTVLYPYNPTSLLPDTGQLYTPKAVHWYSPTR